jgi:3-dehydroquinate dehydratase
MHMKMFLLLFGPNLYRVEKRDPALYGTLSLAQIEKAVRGSLRDAPIEVETRQSN